MSIVAILRWAVILMGVLVLQTVAPVFWEIRLNLILLLVFFYGRRFGEVRGLAFGALSGMLLDIFSGTLIGPHTLSKGIAGYGAAWLPRLFFRENRVIVMLCMVFLTLLDGAIVKIVFKAFSPLGGPDMPSVLRQAVIVGLLWTLLNLICSTEPTEEQHT